MVCNFFLQKKRLPNNIDDLKNPLYFNENSDFEPTIEASEFTDTQTKLQIDDNVLVQKLKQYIKNDDRAILAFAAF